MTMYEIETLRIEKPRHPRRGGHIYYAFNSSAPKTRYAVWCGGTLYPTVTEETYNTPTASSNVDLSEHDFDEFDLDEPVKFTLDDFYTAITTTYTWTRPTPLELLVITGLTVDNYKEILWGALEEDEESLYPTMHTT